MATAPVKVLLVAENTVGFYPLLERLENCGYQCEVTPSCEDGARLVAEAPFDVALCSVGTQNLAPLLSAVQSSSSSLFRYLLVQDGCWWVPSVLRGEPCSDAPAFRDSELPAALAQIVNHVHHYAV
jgi:hypothetical protein